VNIILHSPSVLNAIHLSHKRFRSLIGRFLCVKKMAKTSREVFTLFCDSKRLANLIMNGVNIRCEHLTSQMWLSVVSTLIDNDTRHHSGKNVVDFLGSID